MHGLIGGAFDCNVSLFREGKPLRLWRRPGRGGGGGGVRLMVTYRCNAWVYGTGRSTAHFQVLCGLFPVMYNLRRRQ